MIVPMKKIAVIVTAGDAESALNKLRSLGIVHIEHQKAPQGKDIAALCEDISLVDQAISILSAKELSEGNNIKQKELNDWKFSSRQTEVGQAHHIIDAKKRIEQLEEYSRLLVSRIVQWALWGDFEPEKIQELAKENIYLRLYQIPEKEINNLPKELIVKKISVFGGIINCALISRDKVDIPYKEISLPKMGLAKMQARLAEDSKVIEHLNKELRKCAAYSRGLARAKNTLATELEFSQALRGMGEAGALSYLAGYVPKDKVGPLTGLAKKEKWGLLVIDPLDTDNVPVLLRNPKWVSVIKPVFKLMEVVPGYRELDVSPIFLLFLALFFGMIIGDAGYGITYFLVTFLVQRKLGKSVKDKSAFFLFYLFSSCAIMWGLLTGTVFGQEWYLAKGFKAFLPVLNQAKFLMSFCFFLGAFQLSLAHAWQALAKLPSLKALADAGFICLLWAGFFLAKMFIVGDPFPPCGKWLLWAGVLLILFFSNPQKNILKSALDGLGVLALGAIGNFGDVVSYIRLFAVGLAGVAVADSVNMLAAGVGSNIIAQAVVLFIGHTINIVLGPISVLIHGIRLNVLEFSLLHGNITWSGFAYRPLKS